MADDCEKTLKFSSQNSGKPAQDRAWFSEPRSSIAQDSSMQNRVTYPLHGSEASRGDGKAGECVICLEPLNTMSCSTLHKCGHKFHTHCLAAASSQTKECPTCRTFYGVITGNQPFNGIMTFKHVAGKIPGFNSPNHIRIYYDFPDGYQTSEHPRPGTPYSGTHRTAYLPSTPEGNLVLKLLKVAFERRLIFTVGDSITTGKQNTVVWNDILHKTRFNGSEYGYPDDTYLDRVVEELKAVGVTPESLN